MDSTNRKEDPKGRTERGRCHRLSVGFERNKITCLVVVIVVVIASSSGAAAGR